MQKAKDNGVKLMLPVDTKVGKEFKPDTESKTVLCTEIPSDWEGFDIGEESIKMFSEELKKAMCGIRGFQMVMAILQANLMTPL